MFRHLLGRALRRNLNRAGTESLSATVLVRKAGTSDPFVIFAQDSKKRFAADLQVPPFASVAGQVIEQDAKPRENGASRGLIYVPSSRYVHGIRLQFERAGHDDQIFKTGHVIHSAFAAPTQDNEMLRTLV